MNRILKFGLFVVAVAQAFALTSCTDEYEYDPVAKGDNEGAYILADNTSLLFTEQDGQTLTFTVFRHNTEEAKSYRLYCSDSEISVPSEVSFAAGEESKTVTISLNVPKGTMDKEVVIGVQDEDAYTYGAHSQTFTISCLRQISGCVLYQQLYRSTGMNGAAWEINVYEYGVEEKKDDDGNVISSSKRYLIKNPYEEVMPVDGVGYNVTFSLAPNGKATCAAGQTLFNCTPEVSGDASVVGPVYISGGGTYYKDPVELEPGVSEGNLVLFSWSLSIGNTGYGFGTQINAVIFPAGYDPLTQASV